MRTATGSPRSVYIPGKRVLTLLPLVVLPVLLACDLGSVALVRLAAEDDAGEAARAGMNAIQFERTPTPQNAEAAYRAAAEVAALHRQVIDQKTFTIYADGAVKLTATRTAPTLLFKHLPGLRDFAASSTTVTVTRPTW